MSLRVIDNEEKISPFAVTANETVEVTDTVPSLKGMLLQGGITTLGFIVGHLVVEAIKPHFAKAESGMEVQTPSTNGNSNLYVPDAKTARNLADNALRWAEVLDKEEAKAASVAAAAVEAAKKVAAEVAAAGVAARKEATATAEEVVAEATEEAAEAEV